MFFHDLGWPNPYHQKFHGFGFGSGKTIDPGGSGSETMLEKLQLKFFVLI